MPRSFLLSTVTLASALLLSACATTPTAQTATAPTAKMAVATTVAAPAAQPTAKPAAALAPTPVADKSINPNEVVCRTEDNTGSRLRKSKTCLTRAEWDRRTREAAATASGITNETEMQRNPLPSSGGG